MSFRIKQINILLNNVLRQSLFLFHDATFYHKSLCVNQDKQRRAIKKLAVVVLAIGKIV